VTSEKKTRLPVPTYQQVVRYHKTQQGTNKTQMKAMLATMERFARGDY